MQSLIDFFGTNGLLPHGYCLTWSPGLLWLNVLSDVLIALAYYSIPLGIAYFVRQRKDLQYRWLFLMFGAFILACGTTHLISAVTIWVPLYWLDGWMKAMTAAISVVTAVVMIWVIPRALQLPSPAQMEALRSASLYTRSLIEASLDPAVTISPNGKIMDVNKATEQVTGISREALIGSDFSDPFTEPDKARNGYRQAFSQGAVTDYPLAIRRRDGHIAEVLYNASIYRDAAGQVAGVFASARDITERRKGEEALKLAGTVFNTVGEAVMVTDADNNIVTVNPAFTAITGFSQEEVIGRNPRMLRSGVHASEFFQALWTTLLETGAWSGEITNRRKDGTLYIEGLSIRLVRDEDGKIRHHVGVFSDITERKATEEYVRHLAHFDVLTDLPNRALLTDRLHQALAQARRDQTMLAVMFLDLDKFKPVNDTLGHDIGDLLLKQVAQRLQACVQRESDTVSRIGGDEFVILLPHVAEEEDTVIVVEKVLHTLSQPFTIGQHTIDISSSIGIAIYPQHGEEAKLLMKNADTAMYHAKKSGRNCYRLFSAEMAENAWN